MILFFLDQSFKIQCELKSFSVLHIVKFSHFFIAFQPSSLCKKATKKIIKYYVEL